MRVLHGLHATLASVGGSLWGLLDADQPLFCDCTATQTCVDCSLLGPVDDLDATAVA
jgi:hypothetical protein